MKILLTGFEPFDQETVNPSWEAVQRVKAPEGGEILRHCLPVSFRAAPLQLEEMIRRNRPELVLSVGLAGGRDAVSLERIAVNLMDARIPDNDGFKPQEEPLVPGGENAYFSSLPLKELEALLKAKEIPVRISNTAGLYVCNAVFYTAAHLAATLYPQMKAGFVHVPYLPEQSREGTVPSLSLAKDVKALEEIVHFLLC